MHISAAQITKQPTRHLSLGHLGIEGAVCVGSLEVAVASQVLAVDEDVGDGALARLLLERVLDVVAVGHLVQLDRIEGVAFRLERLLGGVAVRAVRLAVHHDAVRGDLAVNLLNQVFSHSVLSWVFVFEFVVFLCLL